MNIKTKAQQFIQDTSGVFAPNGIISQTTLCTYFGITPPDLENATTLTETVDEINKFNNAKLAAYGAINKLIRPIGLVVKQETVRTTSSVTIQYRILNKSETSHKIKSFRKQAKTATANARTLRAGYRSANSDGTYLLSPSYKPTKKRGRPAKYPPIPGIED